MNTSLWAQILAIVRLEIWKTFFSRRGLWIYLFALAPVLLFTANSIYAPREQARLARIAETHPVALTNLTAIARGMSNSVVIEQLGEPYQQRTLAPSHRRRPGQRTRLLPLHRRQKRFHLPLLQWPVALD